MRLHAQDLAGHGRYHGLIMQNQFVIVYGPIFVGKLMLYNDLFLHFLSTQTILPLPLGFSLVHGNIGS